MSTLRWHEVLEDITKVEHKYKIKNPLWDSKGWKGVFKDYGFVPVDGKGEWWTRIPDSPEIPIIYAPLVTTSATTAGAIAGTSSTALIETATPIIDVAYTEIAGGGATATVTTGGVVTSVSSSVATGAIGAAIGFGVGVGGFELAPEFWTRVSNAVFGTDLDPNEIGQMARDTNALVVIKDGIVYMAKDMINAIRNAFFDNGADNTSIIYPAITDTIPVTITTWGNIQSIIKDYMSLLSGVAFANPEFQSVYDEFKTFTGYGAFKGVTYYNSDGSIRSIVLEIRAGSPKQGLPWNTTASKIQNGAEIYYTCPNTECTVSYWLRLDWDYGKEYFDYSSNKAWAYKYNNTLETIYYGKGTKSPTVGSWTSSVNVTSVGAVDGITPTGEQGTKNQPIEVLFPDWVSKGIKTVAGDGETKVDWLPVSIPDNDPIVEGNPFTTEKAQEGILPDDDTETLGQISDNAQDVLTNTPNYPTPPIPPEPTITPTPNPPILIGAASIGLANLYNPTLAQLKEFSRWLWGTDFNLDQLKKLFQDPMQAIIGLHVLYATPTTGSEEGIQLGYINSGVNSKTVTKQYIDIDCGTVTVNEYFGDARDYSPFTQTFCYLPFIGIVELNADDVINSNLTIKYRIDVLTGCCLAQLTVKKFGLDAVLYTYTGNCAVQMPITSGSYLSTITSLLGAVAGVVGGALTGGVAGAVVGGVHSASHLQKASVTMSGSLGSNAGAMGIRKPYIIIKRVEEADASGYNEFYGYPTNRRALLSDLSGFVRVKDINLSGVTATAEEQAEIITLLKEGVII